MDEGLGELAMWLFGNPDIISGFNTSPDNSLIDWGSAWADYIQTYLWTLYAYEQFGGLPTIWDLVHHPSNGMSGYLNALAGQGYNITMEDVFGVWAVANFLDDTLVVAGQYGYDGDTLPPFSAFRTHDTFPAAGSGTVQNWAADYIRLTGLTAAPTLHFDGMDTREFRVAYLARDPSLPTLVRWVPLDNANDGVFEFNEAVGYAEVIIAIANVYDEAHGNPEMPTRKPRVGGTGDEIAPALRITFMVSRPLVGYFRQVDEDKPILVNPPLSLSDAYIQPFPLVGNRLETEALRKAIQKAKAPVDVSVLHGATRGR